MSTNSNDIVGLMVIMVAHLHGKQEVPVHLWIGPGFY